MRMIKSFPTLLGRAVLVILAYIAAVLSGFMEAVARGDHVPEPQEPQADDVHKYHYDMEKSHWNTNTEG